MFSMDPPEDSKINGNVNDPMFQGFFDMTLSYRHDSDIYRPYGAFVDKTTSATNPNVMIYSYPQYLHQ